ncbi:MAG: hypothetical protein J6J53_00610 [Muribaculaceae bacterium]|nr:hypothetical protein [Muribaculaceae bacterium]
MTDEEFESEKSALNSMLDNLRLIKDKGRRQWLIREIRTMVNELIRS